MKKLFALVLCLSMAFAMAAQASAIEVKSPAATAAVVETAGLEAKDGDITISASGDISSNIQSAISAGYTNITVPAGTYTLNSRIYLASGTCSGNVTINATGCNFVVSSSLIHAIRIDSVAGVTIIGGTWDGAGKLPLVVDAASPKNLTLTDMTIKNCTDRGIRVSKNGTAAINNVTVTNIGGGNVDPAGLGIQENSTVVINGITVTGVKGTGIIAQTANLTIDGTVNPVTVEDNWWNGLSGTQGANVTIIGGSFSNNGVNPKGNDEGASGHGLAAGQKSTLTVTGATINNNGVCGISPFNDCSLTISKSNISNNKRHGIGGRMNVTMNVKNCSVNNNAMNGVGSSDNCVLKISGGSVKNNGECGLSISGGKASVKNVTVANNKTSEIGIRKDGHGPANVSEISGCKITSKRPYAVLVKDKSTVKKFDANTITMNNLTATAVKSSGNSRILTVSNNNISGKMAYAIQSESLTANMTISGNVISTSNPAGKSFVPMYLSKGGSYTYSVKKNKVSGNQSNYGIRLEKTKAVVSDNTISKSTHPIFVPANNLVVNISNNKCSGNKDNSVRVTTATKYKAVTNAPTVTARKAGTGANVAWRALANYNSYEVQGSARNNSGFKTVGTVKTNRFAARSAAKFYRVRGIYTSGKVKVVTPWSAVAALR